MTPSYTVLSWHCVSVGGGIVLRCDVFVDTIHRIEITTRTRELLLEEEPERFELQGYDEEGEKEHRKGSPACLLSLLLSVCLSGNYGFKQSSLFSCSFPATLPISHLSTQSLI